MTTTQDSAGADSSSAGSGETSGENKPAKTTKTTASRSGGLSTMLLADLKAMASGLGIRGTGSMKKAQLVEAIKAAQSGRQSSSQSSPTEAEDKPTQQMQEKPAKQEKPSKQEKRAKEQKQGQQDRQDRQGKQDQQHTPDRPAQEQQEPAAGEGTSRRNRRRRGRDRQTQPTQPNQPQGGQGGGQSQRSPRNEPDTTILDDDVLVPAAGILDVLDNYAFVRTSGYLPGVDDVYVSLSMVRKYGLRRGDAIVGQVRHPREGERKEKFNPMVRIDGVNGADPESAKHRAEFATLTALSPTERLRLETDPANLIGRAIDLVAPIGKGQRGLIVSPAKAGKTTVLQSIARSITANNPECHLMVILVDERPEEVTDFERSVKGEVISSTFDRPPADHTTVAELAIERAKRLVELGHDVVVLLDGITRLGRAYNLALPSSGRLISGAVDAGALFPPKRFFGAARNIENGGSLTILATATVESGSTTDEVLFEGLQGTGNYELRLRRELADKRLFPAIDPVQSGTRHEDQLIGPEELQVLWKLRRQLADLDTQAALETLVERLRGSQTNLELLRRVQQA